MKSDRAVWTKAQWRLRFSFKGITCTYADLFKYYSQLLTLPQQPVLQIWLLLCFVLFWEECSLLFCWSSWPKAMTVEKMGDLAALPLIVQKWSQNFYNFTILSIWYILKLKDHLHPSHPHFSRCLISAPEGIISWSLNSLQWT